MTSESREIAHDQHTHPGWKFYGLIGLILIGLTVLEVLGYVWETNGTLGEGAAAAFIAVLSAAKFIIVVMFYMHLKYDHKLFTGVFVFPALLGTLVIAAMWILEQKIDLFEPSEAPPVEIITVPAAGNLSTPHE